MSFKIFNKRFTLKFKDTTLINNESCGKFNNMNSYQEDINSTIDYVFSQYNNKRMPIDKNQYTDFLYTKLDISFYNENEVDEDIYFELYENLYPLYSCTYATVYSKRSTYYSKYYEFEDIDLIINISNQVLQTEVIVCFK